MLTLPSSVRVYLAAQPVDLRRGHDGLIAIVRAAWGLNPFDGHLFVFLGRRLDRVKILVWDHNGFVLYYKRLSQGRFRMPSVPEGAVMIPRFRGHPNRREDAPGVFDGEARDTKEATVIHPRVQG